MNAALQVWDLGLLNKKSGKFLSQETVGSGLNAKSALFRAKQKFRMEQEGDISHCHLKATRGYVSAGPKGELNSTNADKGADTVFTIEVQEDGTWAFKSKHGYYLSAEKDDELHVFARAVTDAECFSVQMSIHPQICLLSPARNAYAHLEEDELRANEVIPWGFDAMVTLLFVKSHAKYAIRVANNKFWNCKTKLSTELDTDCLWVPVLAEGGKIAFRGNNGKYLTAPTSSNSVMKASAGSVGANETFVLEDSHAQILISASNNKHVSISKNEDPQVVHAGKDYADTEIFQIETNGTGWSFRTNGNKYWQCSSEGNLKTGSKEEATYFKLDWSGPNVMISTPEGKFLSYKPQGSMKFSESSGDAETCKFAFDIVNRPQLVLRCDWGFVTSQRTNDGCACNAAEVDTFFLHSSGGKVKFQGQNGKFWALADDGSISASSASGDEFHLEFRAHTKFAIRAAKTNQYVSGGQQGQFKANLTTPDNSAMWEY